MSQRVAIFIQNATSLAGQPIIEGVTDTSGFLPGDAVYIHNPNGSSAVVILSAVATNSLTADSNLPITIVPGASLTIIPSTANPYLNTSQVFVQTVPDNATTNVVPPLGTLGLALQPVVNAFAILRPNFFGLTVVGHTTGNVYFAATTLFPASQTPNFTWDFPINLNLDASYDITCLQVGESVAVIASLNPTQTRLAGRIVPITAVTSVLFPSQSYVVSTIFTILDNLTGVGIAIVWSVTAGGGTVTCNVKHRNAVSGEASAIAYSSAAIAVGNVGGLRVYPGVTPVANAVFNDCISGSMRIEFAIAGAPTTFNAVATVLP